MRRICLQPSLPDWIVATFASLVTLSVALAPASPVRTSFLVYLSSVTLGFALAVVAYRSFVASGRSVRVVTYVYRLAPVAVVSAIFFRLRDIIPLANPNEYDAALHAIDVALLGRDLSVAAEAISTPTFIEWNAFWYSLYFPLGIALILAEIFGDRDEARRTRFAVGTLTVFCVGHFTYILVPGLGPVEHLKHLYENPELPQGFFMRQVLDTYSIGAQHDIFPSLHTALPAWWVLYLLAERRSRFHRWSLLLIVPMAVNTWIATIVLRWHYTVDLVAGFVLSYVAYLAAQKGATWHEKRRAEAGISPAYW